MNSWDVIVIGAGQAGSAGAWDLAAAGLRVLVLSRSEGAGKPCAGGLTMKTVNRYRFAIDPVVRETVDTLHVSHFPGPEAALKASTRFCVMTERCELDRFCLQQACDQGARFQLTRGVTSVRQDASGVQLSTREGETFQGRYLIAADGANSPVRRLLGEKAWRGAMAIEGHIDRKDLARYPGMTLDFGAVEGGYGWLFPKGDHVNVGLYIWQHGLAAPDRKALDRYCEKTLGVRPHKVSGFPLGTWLPRARDRQGRVLFAGDAAGCTEPLLGEGIYGAVLSGQLAAQSILAGQPESYREMLLDWQEELAKVHQLSALFYGLPRISVPMLKGRLGHSLVDGYARGYTLGQCKRRWRGAPSLV